MREGRTFRIYDNSLYENYALVGSQEQIEKARQALIQNNEMDESWMISYGQLWGQEDWILHTSREVKSSINLNDYKTELLEQIHRYCYTLENNYPQFREYAAFVEKIDLLETKPFERSSLLLELVTKANNMLEKLPKEDQETILDKYVSKKILRECSLVIKEADLSDFGFDEDDDCLVFKNNKTGERFTIEQTADFVSDNVAGDFVLLGTKLREFLHGN